MSTTAQVVIDKSFRRIGVLRAGQTPSSSERQDGFLALNGLVDQWRGQPWTPNKITRNEFALVNGQSTYTFGSGGDWNIAVLPGRIEYASFVQFPSTNQSEQPIPILNEQQYAQRVANKNQTNALPYAIFPNGAFPIESVRVMPVPLGVAADTKIVLYLHTPLDGFADLNATTYTFPYGVEKALYLGLAVDLWPMFLVNNKVAHALGVATLARLYDVLKREADQALGIVKRNNLQTVEMACSTALDDRAGLYNIYGDNFLGQ